MASYLDTKAFREPYAARNDYSANRYDHYGRGGQQAVATMTPRSVESQSSSTSKTANEVNNSVNLIERYADEIFEAHAKQQSGPLQDWMQRYDIEVRKMRDKLGALRFDGREHLRQQIIDQLENWESDEFRRIDQAWSGYQGICGLLESCRKNWAKIARIVTPASENALANVIRQHTGSQALSDSGVLRGKSIENQADVLQSAWSQGQQPGQVPGIVNLNIAGADAQAHAKQRSTQELESDLRLAQTIDIANTQEQRFRSLLQDLNSASVELACQMNQAQQAEQSLQELSETTNRILTHLESQNTAAQNIVHEVKQDRGLSRALLTACAALLVCVGIPKLRVLLPFFRQVPIVRSYARNIERGIRTGDRSIVAENLVRERSAYRTVYELLAELSEMRDDGNILHKIAFSFLGLGKNLGKRVMLMPPPSDSLCDTERWVDRRLGPYGPPQWEKMNGADPR